MHVYTRGTASSTGTLCYRMGDTYHWSVWTEDGGASGWSESFEAAKAKAREMFDRMKKGDA